MKFNGTGEMIDALEFPITTDEIIANHGDHELELQRGTERVGEVLERLGTEEFDGPEDVRLSVRSAVGHKAIGRRFYSDRDQYSPGEHGPEQVSF